MSKTQSTLIIALLLLVACLQAVSTFIAVRSEIQPAKWEYRIESFEDRSFDASVNMLGDLGWELSASRRAVTGEGASSRGLYECIFKRRK